MLRQSTVKLTDQSPAYAPSVSSEQSATYSVKSFVTPDGVTVREYVAPSGTIFGVGWQGHRPPDLSILFGSYFGEYMSASQAARHKDLHRSRVVGPDSVVVMSGHMGRVQGRAWVPSLIPSGVDPQAVVKCTGS